MRDERGTVAVPMLVVCMTMLAMTALVFAIFAGYVAKRSGQTAADAAALGALQVLGEKLPDLFAAEVAPRVAVFWYEVQQAMDEWEEQQEERAEACSEKRKDEPEYDGTKCESPTAEERREYWLDACDALNARVGEAMCLAQEDGAEVPLLERVNGFLSHEERGCVILRPGAGVTEAMFIAADGFSRQNGGPALDRLKVVYPFRRDPSAPYAPVVLVQLEQPLSAFVLDRRGIPSGASAALIRATAGLNQLQALDPSYPTDLDDC